MRKRLSMLAAVMCAVMMVGGLSVTAYAGGGDYIEETPPVTEWEGLDPVEETPAPTTQPGEGFTEDGSLVTRDLLYDKHTNKQFITVQTSGGNTFYIVIDYDKPVNEEEEQYQTYFFSVVDEADLLTAMEAAGMEVPACACAVKCAAGAINTDCPVCATNMTECAGAAPDPEPVPESEGGSNMGMLLLIAAVALIGGGAGWYFKVYRPKHQRAEQPEEDYGDELEDYDDTGLARYAAGHFSRMAAHGTAPRLAPPLRCGNKSGISCEKSGADVWKISPAKPADTKAFRRVFWGRWYVFPSYPCFRKILSTFCAGTLGQIVPKCGQPKEVLWTSIKATPSIRRSCWKTAGALPWVSIPRPRLRL